MDGNHQAVVDALRKAGVWVLSLASVGKGCPDLLVAFRNTFCLLEVKDGSKFPSERLPSKALLEFISTCPGPVYVVSSPAEAVSMAIEAARPRSA